jgi:hypothetical protein
MYAIALDFLLLLLIIIVDCLRAAGVLGPPASSVATDQDAGNIRARAGQSSKLSLCARTMHMHAVTANKLLLF